MTALVGASERDVLQQLVDDLDRAREFGGPPLICRLYASGQRETDQLEPTETALSDALLGWRAPDDCTAVAAAGSGWALHPDDRFDLERGTGRGPRPRDRPDRTLAASVVVVSRSGLELSRVRLESGLSFDQARPGGVVADCLRRCLARPTGPPALGTAYLFAAIWLDRVLELAGRQEGPLAWSRVVRSHPAMQLFERCGERMPVASFVEVARAMGNVLDWHQVRFEIVERGWLNELCPPDLAGWMDDGMLSRWLVSAWPSVEELSQTAGLALEPSVARRVRAALRQLGVLRR